MRICRYRTSEGPRYGAVIGELIHALNGDPFGEPSIGEPVEPVSGATLLAPTEPSKVVCVGANYAAHIEELNLPRPDWPLIFMKTPNTVIGHNATIYRPSGVERVDYEGELGVVIRRSVKDLERSTIWDAILGYTCANDVTVRDWQSADGQWTRAKNADTFCPIGPWIETEIEDPEHLRVRTLVNDQVRQDGSTSDLVFGIADILTFVTEWITLDPGDVIITGTPRGVGPIEGGDRVTVEVERVGSLSNPVKQL